MDDALTLDTLKGLLEAFPPLPFVAYTMNPPTYALIRSRCLPHPFDSPPILNGVEVWEVLIQKADCIEWKDEKLLRAYLKAHEEG